MSLAYSLARHALYAEQSGSILRCFHFRLVFRMVDSSAGSNACCGQQFVQQLESLFHEHDGEERYP